MTSFFIKLFILHNLIPLICVYAMELPPYYSSTKSAKITRVKTSDGRNVTIKAPSDKDATESGSSAGELSAERRRSIGQEEVSNRRSNSFVSYGPPIVLAHSASATNAQGFNPPAAFQSINSHQQPFHQFYSTSTSHAHPNYSIAAAYPQHPQQTIGTYYAPMNASTQSIAGWTSFHPDYGYDEPIKMMPTPGYKNEKSTINASSAQAWQATKKRTSRGNYSNRLHKPKTYGGRNSGRGGF